MGSYSESPMLSASSASYSPPVAPLSYSPHNVPYVTTTANSHSQQENLWHSSNSMMYEEQLRFQQQQQQHQHHQYQELSKSNFRHPSPTRALRSNLDPDSIMKIHDDLPSAAILARERHKAKKKTQRLKRN